MLQSSHHGQRTMSLMPFYTMTAVTDITFFGHYFLQSNIFVEKSVCEFMD